MNIIKHKLPCDGLIWDNRADLGHFFYFKLFLFELWIARFTKFNSGCLSIGLIEGCAVSKFRKSHKESYLLDFFNALS